MTHLPPLKPLPAPLPPLIGYSRLPPTTSTRPSASSVWPRAPEVGRHPAAVGEGDVPAGIGIDRRRDGRGRVGQRIPDVGVAAVDRLVLRGPLGLGEVEDLVGGQHHRVDRRGGDRQQGAPFAVRLRALLGGHVHRGEPRAADLPGGRSVLGAEGRVRGAPRGVGAELHPGHRAGLRRRARPPGGRRCGRSRRPPPGSGRRWAAGRAAALRSPWGSAPPPRRAPRPSRSGRGPIHVEHSCGRSSASPARVCPFPSSAGRFPIRGAGGGRCALGTPRQNGAVSNDPLTQEIPYADPLALFARVAGDRHAALLHSAAADARGRYSFIAAEPFKVLVCREGVVEIDGVPAPGAPLDVVRAELARHPQAAIPGIGPFCGGAVGYLGYEMGRHLERVPRPPADAMDVPEMQLLFCDVVVVLDHRERRAHVVSTGHPEPAGDGAPRAGAGAPGGGRPALRRRAAPARRRGPRHRGRGRLGRLPRGLRAGRPPGRRVHPRGRRLPGQPLAAAARRAARGAHGAGPLRPPLRRQPGALRRLPQAGRPRDRVVVAGALPAPSPATPSRRARSRGRGRGGGRRPRTRPSRPSSRPARRTAPRT